MTIKYLIQKEFIQIRRNAFLPKMIIMFPLMIMCILPWVTNLEVRNINVRVVDNDHSVISGRLVHRVEASNYFVFKGISYSYSDALSEVEKGNTDIILEIPYHYERNLVNGKNPQILIAANAVNGTKGGMGASYMANIVNDNISETNISTSAKVQAVKLYTLNLYNPHQNYKVYMIPALMAILIVLLCGFMPALNIVGEKEKGTIEQINVTPVSKGSFILAKLIPYWVIGMLVMTICFILSWTIYGISPAGNVALLYCLAMLLALTFSGIGLIVSNYSDTMQQAMFVMWFIMVCVLLLSGLFTPVRSMPDWARAITIVDPLKYFIDGMRTVFVRGAGISGIATQLYALTGFAAFINIWAVVSYKKNN